MKTIDTKNSTVKRSFLWLFLALFWVACSSENKEGSVKAPNVDIITATFTGNIKEVRNHIAAKSDLNVKDDFGSLPLTVAATFDKTEIALALIEGGADLNAQSADGSTPLHTAAFYGRVEIVEALLEKGADINVRNSYGSTALESVQAPFEAVKPVYDQLSRDLGQLGLRLDYDELKAARIVIADMIQAKQ